MNYKKVEECLRELRPFEHGKSMSAKWHGDTYEVYSYRTRIATFERISHAVWISEEKYSVTTTKQQRKIRFAWLHL